MRLTILRIAAALLVSLGSRAAAQANANPGIDVRLSAMRTIDALGREGDFPDGVNGISFDTTVCNEGTIELPWFQPMNPDHPMIAFLIAGVRDGRIVQLSNRSYVKHGFFATNGSGCQTTCIRPGGSTIGEYLGVGCSDTYGSANNGDNYYLGPPDEIDPWLGLWERRCSLFDRGYPEVDPPANCNGLRSLSRGGASDLGPVHSRVQVSDEDLILGGPLFFQGQYVVEGLPDAARDDSLGSRPFDAVWNGNRWNLDPSGPLLPGTVLQRWPAATLSANTDPGDRGRVFVAVKVTGPTDGFYHYEYALHNRDSTLGVSTLRIPLCSGARVRAAGFRDIDADAANDWSASVKADASELVFAGGDARLRWNTIFNFWFDSDAAPGEGALALELAEVGPRQATFRVPSRAPTMLYNVYLGPGCALDTPPTLHPYGTPARAQLGNATFGLASSGNASFQPNVLLYGIQPGSRSLHGCTLWTGAGRVSLASVVTSDASGVARHAIPIPLDLALEGRSFRAQALGRDPAHGALLADFELSEGLLVRLGNAIPDCP